MNIRIPTAEAIKRIEKRIKEIKAAAKKNAEIKGKNEEARKNHETKMLQEVLTNHSKYKPNFGWHYNGEATVSFTLGRSFKFPEQIPCVPSPGGNLADLERVLELLKISSSPDVNLKAIKGLAEMV